MGMTWMTVLEQLVRRRSFGRLVVEPFGDGGVTVRVADRDLPFLTAVMERRPGRRATLVFDDDYHAHTVGQAASHMVDVAWRDGML